MNMHLKWTDVEDIAIELNEKYPDIDPQWVSFVCLRQWICDLETFSDDPERCNERILEAIQASWIDEKS